LKRIISGGIIILGVCLALSLAELKSNSSKDIAAQTKVLIEGRALSLENEIRLSFPGSQLRLKTNSSDMSLHFEETREHKDSALDFQVNGGDWKTHYIGGASVLDLADENQGGTIDVRLIRRSEAWQGDIILSRAVARGGFIKPAPFPKTKLLFIGDSITAGAGTTSRVSDKGEREAVSNARLAYSRVLGDRLDAQVHHVAYGGRGLTRDWQGITDTNNAPQFYDRILPDNPDHLWDPQNYQADIVSVMLGTNDFNPGIPDRESWTKTYQDFVARIRKDYPKAQIFLISSPMTGGEKGDALKSYVKAVGESFETDTIQYLEVSQTYGEAWDAHPTAAEHEKIADELEPAFRKALDSAGH